VEPDTVEAPLLEALDAAVEPLLALLEEVE
jgi:hypothetical protein